VSSESHEKRDVRFRPLLLISVGFILLVAAVMVLMALFFNFYYGRPLFSLRPGPSLAERQLPPPEPIMDAQMAEAIAEEIKKKERALSSYGWADRKAGVAQIPVERAMELMLEKGFPTRTESAGPP
jgi:hypothetical protein